MKLGKAKPQLTAKEILGSSDNCRGAKFDPTWNYVLVNERRDMVPRYETDGYKTLVEDVHDRLGRDTGFRLMGRPGQ